MSDEKKFTRHEIQEWVSSLDDRQQAMFAHAVGEAEFRAACDTLREAAEHCAKLAQRLAKEDRKTRSKAVRMVVGILLTLHRDAEDAAREFSGEKPITRVVAPVAVQ